MEEQISDADLLNLDVLDLVNAPKAKRARLASLSDEELSLAYTQIIIQNQPNDIAVGLPTPSNNKQHAFTTHGTDGLSALQDLQTVEEAASFANDADDLDNLGGATDAVSDEALPTATNDNGIANLDVQLADVLPTTDVQTVHEADSSKTGDDQESSDESIQQTDSDVEHKGTPLSGETQAAQSTSTDSTPGPSHITSPPSKADFVIDRSDEKHYDIVSRPSRSFKGDVISERTYTVTFTSGWTAKPASGMLHVLHDILNEVLEAARREYAPVDLVRLFLTHPTLHKAIVIPPRPLGDLTAEAILDRIEQVIQSNEDLALDTDFIIQLGVVKMRTGGKGTATTNVNKDRMRKRSIVTIKNDDNLCMPRALAVAMAHLKKTRETDPMMKAATARHYKRMTTGDQGHHTSLQKRTALEYCRGAGVDPDTACSIRDAVQFEQYLNVGIYILAAHIGNKKLRVPSAEYEQNIYLYYIKGVQGNPDHYDCITSVPGLLGRSYFCEKCIIGYNVRGQHVCQSCCGTCGGRDCKNNKSFMCPDCNLQCRSNACFNRHKQARKRFIDKDTIEPLPSLCDSYYRCLECQDLVNVKIRSKTEHVCGEFYCHNCESFVMGEHMCYLRYKEPEKACDKFIFYDVETEQHTGIHNVNYVVAQKACRQCEDEPCEPDSVCTTCGDRCSECGAYDKENECYYNSPCPDMCGKREYIFEGEGAMNEFGEWLFNESNSGTTVIAHNSKGYDSVFLLDYCLNNSMIPDPIIYNGSKIMYMVVKKGLSIRMVDSLNFFGCSLSKLSSMFDLEASKGYFPHFANKPEYWGRQAKHPDPQFYGADTMSPQGRTTFFKWYETVKDTPFDFWAEMEKYCRMDVRLLREACIKFKNLFKETTKGGGVSFDPVTGDMKSDITPGLDPFSYVTIASLCMAVFRHSFYSEDWMVLLRSEKEEAELENRPPKWVTAELRDRGHMYVGDDMMWVTDDEITAKQFIKSPIAKLPAGGYGGRDNFSKVSMEWLMWEEKQRGIPIQHALKPGGEKKLNNGKGGFYKLDGYIPGGGQEGGDIALEFFGCAWHGCPTCHPSDRIAKPIGLNRTVRHPFNHKPMEVLYELTKIKQKHLESQGFTYVAMWECQWRKLVANDLDLQNFIANLDIQPRLQPKDAFFGGRTDGNLLHYKVKEGQTIQYVDFTSLYPTVQKYDSFPVGHPEVITSNFSDDIDDYYGLIKCKILPPRHLKLPVLPQKLHGKLSFHLCQTCAENESQELCQHTDTERAMIGTWVSLEIQEALKRGYELVEIYEVYHWSETAVHDKVTGTGGLFSEYVQTFLKLKTEASGYPPNCDTPEQKKEFVKEFYKREGVPLDPENIEKVPGRRALAKLCLNSFWGKFGQRDSMPQHKFVTEPSDFYHIVTDASKNIADWHILNDDLVLVDTKHVGDFIPESNLTNIFLACFVTAQARLRLYKLLMNIGPDNVLYYDTDSVIYIQNPGAWTPECGAFLGDLTNELPPGRYIVEFVCCGPKNYGYKLDDGTCYVKVKGFTLNYQNSQKINFETLCKELFMWKEGQSQHITLTNASQITRDKYKVQIYNKEQSKTYRVVYTKRMVNDDFTPLPYGYCN